MRQRQRELEARERREQMLKLREMKFNNVQIGRLYGISSKRVGQIFKRIKEIDEKRVPLEGLSMRAYHVLQSALNTDSPTMIDLSRLILRNADWRRELFKVRLCGLKTLKEIEEYAVSNGMLVGPPERPLAQLSERAYNVLKKAISVDVPDLGDLRRYIKETHDWRRKLGRMSGCGPKTMEEIEDFAIKKGLARKL